MDRRWLYAGLLAAAGVGIARVLKKPKLVPGESRILLVGDSLAVGLSTPLKALATDQRIGFNAVAQVGTRIDQWGGKGTPQSAQLDAALDATQPTLVLVSLGTNDEYITMGNPPERQAPYLKALIEKIERYVHKGDYGLGAELIWIGPPTLPKKGTNGIRALLAATIPQARFFDSQRLSIPRAPDNLHSTPKGYAGWAGALWQWLS